MYALSLCCDKGCGKGICQNKIWGVFMMHRVGKMQICSEKKFFYQVKTGTKKANLFLKKNLHRLASIGVWRSLVAHHAGGVGAVGSNPTTPTTHFSNLTQRFWRFS